MTPCLSPISRWCSCNDIRPRDFLTHRRSVCNVWHTKPCLSTVVWLVRRTIFLATTSLWHRVCSASSWTQHTLFALRHSDQTIFITQSHSSLLPTCFTSSLEPASCVAQNSSSELFIPLSVTLIWTRRFDCCTLLSPSITFHCFILSLNKPFF